jgi:hypothetical protein
VLRVLTFAVAAFVALTLGAMAAVYVATEPRHAPVAPRPPEAVALDPAAASAPLIVLPPPAAPPAAPYVPPPDVQIETLAPPPPVAPEPGERARQLVAFREARRSAAMDQLNAREALRRQRLGLPPPAPLAIVAPVPLPPHDAAARRGARLPAARRGPRQEQTTP